MKSMNQVYRRMIFTGLSITALIVFVFSLSACSSSETSAASSDEQRTYIFHQDGTAWQAELRNGRIVELYRNDERVPDNEIENYESFIQKRIKEDDKRMDDFSRDMKAFTHKMRDFNMEEAHAYTNIDLRNIDFNFDTEEFRNDMEKMSSDLKIAFDSDSFRDAMEQIKNIKVDIDLAELNKQMESVKEQLADVKVNINNVKPAIKKYQRFYKDLKIEMRKDGVIDECDEDFSLKFTPDEMRINGKKVAPELHKKYLKMYEDRFGEMKGGIYNQPDEE